MTINADDIVLMESEVMADTEDGGGRMSGRQVTDGQVNNTFPDISRLDRVYGRTQLRKLFLAVRTANQDTLLGAHTIFTQLPADPRVRVTMFKTGSHTDRRQQARDRIESYVVKGTEAPLYLWGRQLAGQRTIAALQREENAIPQPGDVYCLQRGNGSAEQYVRITDVQPGRQTFTVLVGGSYADFSRRTLVLSLSTPLEFEFDGSDPVPTGRQANTSLILRTQVADAAKYYGSAITTAAAAPGDEIIQVDSVYNQIVPSATSETVLADRTAGAIARPIVAASQNNVAVTVANATLDGEGYRLFYAGGAIVPGSLTFSGVGTYTDQGGALKYISGTNNVTESIVDYAAGLIRVKLSSSATASYTLIYRPGAQIGQNARTWATPITLANRGFNYVFQTPQPPAPGTVVVEYRALGNWYSLRDDGAGSLTGDGAGSVNFATGTITATLAALPDADTLILWSWGESLSYEIQTGAITPPSAAIEYQADGALEPGSVQITWPAGLALNDNGSGSLVGNGSGTVDYARGIVRFTQSTGGQSATLSYSRAGTPADSYTFTGTLAGGQIAGTIPGAPLKPGSVAVNYPVTRPNSSYSSGGTLSPTITATLRDDALGNLKRNGQTVGSINYATGAITFNPVTTFTAYQLVTYVLKAGLGVATWVQDPNPAPGAHVDYKWETYTETEVYTNGSTVTVTSRPNSSVYDTVSETITAPGIKVDLVPQVGRRIVPGSVIFTFRGKTYRDRSGAIVTDISGVTNGATAAGNIDYATGVATLTAYPDGGGAVAIVACLTERGTLPARRIQFRTAAAPLRPGSLILSGLMVAGGAFQATAQTNNQITGDMIQSGTFDPVTGLVNISFWQDVYPDTLKYSAVAIKSLPLEAELIGIDPVRLPADGRVPIFRPGDVVVVSHTAQTPRATLTAGEVITLARHHQAEVWIEGANGRKLDRDQYTLDREAGVITLASPLSLVDKSGQPVTLPVVIYDRVEDMALVTDVQISGALSLNVELSQDYPAGSIVSSAVLHGDTRSRVYNLFHQQTWTGVWSDTRIGNDTTAKYNAAAYPIEITNQGSIEERWAIRFTSASTFEVFGESVGVIGGGNTGGDCAITNPATGVPYFVIRAAGWGSGWATGNTVRFNTEGAQAPIWVARTILSGPATAEEDLFITQNRGDAD
jgi:hypothetical protein